MTDDSLDLADTDRRWRPRLASRRRLWWLAVAIIALAAIAALFVVHRPGGQPPLRIKLHRHAGGAVPKPPEPELNLVKPVSPQEAYAENMAIPVVAGPIEKSKPFVVPSGGSFDVSRLKAVDCLTSAVYYEAASESLQGRRAVAQVVLNRVRHPAYPKSVCGVVYQGSERATGCQFTFTCDGSLLRTPSRSGWEAARKIAEAALAGTVEPSVGTATHYHTVWVVPYWAASLQKIAMIGAHIFYRFPGFWGKRAALSGAYAGESDLGADPLAAAQAVLGETAEDAATEASALTLPPAAKLVHPDAQLAVPEKNADLRVDEDRGRLIADDRAGSGLRVDADKP